MILILFIINLVISILNAIGCGRSWNETRGSGGLPHFLNWCAAIMSASGFTWCYLLLVGFVGASWTVHHDDGTVATLLTIEQLQDFFDLGYLVIIFPVLGSGLALTLSAWRAAWERRTIGTYGVAAWDTFAMIYNVQSALRHVPRASESVLGFFSAKGSGKDQEKFTVLVLVIATALAGVFTTYFIIRSVARSTAQERALSMQLRLLDPATK
jgi:hypothetical protein